MTNCGTAASSLARLLSLRWRLKLIRSSFTDSPLSTSKPRRATSLFPCLTPPRFGLTGGPASNNSLAESNSRWSNSSFGQDSGFYTNFSHTSCNCLCLLPVRPWPLKLFAGLSPQSRYWNICNQLHDCLRAIQYRGKRM